MTSNDMIRELKRGPREDYLYSLTQKNGKIYYSNKYLSELGIMEIEDSEVEEFLRLLEREDDLYERNVLQDVSTLGGRALLACLKGTYSAKEFVVNKLSGFYINNGDKVEVTVDELHLFYPAENAEGIVTKTRESMHLVEFSDFVSAYLPASKLMVYGRKKTFFSGEKRYPETWGDLFRIKKHDRVRYYPNDDEVVRGILKVPESRAEVVECGNLGATLRWHDVPEIERTDVVFYSALTLIRPNKVDYSKLYQEFFGEDLENFNLEERDDS